MDNPKQQAIDRIKQANNVLVTVSTNPSVDQLAACIGLTLMLNKLGKHGTAVFSGTIPSTIEFLKPEDTLEKNTDSLRDFIIALDKSKADKLRYKVEDKVVRIFITPYRASLSEKDLDFSQGDFNVEVVVALGVHEQADLDRAITSHGRILHDATVIAINDTVQGNDLGSIKWQDATASSLSELVTHLGLELDNAVLDSQIATALLTGIVAETDRFSNERTSSRTMNVSAQLMAAGANQQLVAAKLESLPPPLPSPKKPLNNGPAKPSGSDSDGTIAIVHDEAPKEATAENVGSGQIDIDKEGTLHKANGATTSPPAEPLNLPQTEDQSVVQLPAPIPVPAENPTEVAPNSEAGDNTSTSSVDSARSAVESAMTNPSGTGSLPPIAALNAHPVFDSLHTGNQPATASPNMQPTTSISPLSHHTMVSPLGEQPAAGLNNQSLDTFDMPAPVPPANPFSSSSQTAPGVESPNTTTDGFNSFAPPPVPPPMMPMYDPGAPPQQPTQL